MSELKELEATLFSLCTELEDAVPPEFETTGDSITSARADEYRTAIEEHEAEKVSRRELMAAAAVEIKTLWEEMAVTPSDSSIDQAIANGEPVGVSVSIVDSTEGLLESLRTSKAEREAHITSLGQDITKLWKQLEISKAKQVAFLSEHQGIGDSTIAAVSCWRQYRLGRA